MLKETHEAERARGTYEEAIAKIWAEVLRVTSVEPDANFFDIGGDSMKVMEVIQRVSEALHVDLPLMAFFEDPTVAHHASVVDQLRGEETAAPMQRVPGRREFPLSHAQEVFWLLEQQNPGSGIYNTARIFRIHGTVDSAVMERSLNELVRRHEILRVRFIERGDGPVQVVDAGEPLKLTLTDLSALESSVVEQAALKVALETVREPFDLTRGPVLRAGLVRLAAEDYLLLIPLHHVVSDGFTGSILLDELGAIYDAYAAGRASPLPEAELHFTDYADWERKWMQGARLEEELEYWRTTLQGTPSSLVLPIDAVRSADSNRLGRLQTINIPSELLQNVQALGQSNGTTLFTVLAAALRILLYRWSGQADFLLGTIASNRSRSGTERMMGCFVNPLPLRNAVREGESARDLLNCEKNAIMDVFAHQDCPFAKIVEAINPTRTSNDNPLFNVALLLQTFPAIARKSRHFEAESVTFDAQVALLDLRFVATEKNGGLQIDCEYSTNLFESRTIDQLLDSFESVLTQMAAAPETPVKQIVIAESLLARGNEQRRSRHKQMIAIAANFTAEPVEEPLSFWMEQLKIPARIEFAPFDQVFQQLLDPASLLRRNSDGFNLVFIQWRAGQEAGSQARELSRALKTAATLGEAPLIVCICPPTVMEEEELLASELAGQPGVHLLYPAQILDLYPVEHYRDEYANALGAIPYTDEFFVALGSMAARRIYGMLSKPYKVIALDCDNTLWRGVCGEEGPLGVEVDAPHRALQEFMLAQRAAGMLLCLCSKNAENDVAAVLEKNPGMLLRSEHIAASRVNWLPKSENLQDLAYELRLSLDSFILVDDNPLECAEVKSNCPGVLVLELPPEPAEVQGVLRHLWAFDHWSTTQEDRDRGRHYQLERNREELRDGTQDLEEFLRGLELKVDIRPMRREDLGRVAQLTQRTSQFNCNTVQRSESEIARACDEGMECYVVDVRDRFGDYGTVGAVMVAQEADALAVNTLLMSCRALGRKVEHCILSSLGDLALARGLDRVDVRFAKTARNRPAMDFLESVGTEFRTGAVYRIPAARASKSHG